MKTVYGRLAILTAFALASVAVLIPAAPAAAEAPALPALPAQPDSAADDEERETPQSVFAGTAIGVVLEANNNEVPKNGVQMMAILAKFGEFAQLPVAFSAVDLHSGLTKPRVIITQRPSVGLPKALVKPNPAFPDFLIPQDIEGVAPAQAAVSAGTLTRPNLEGRLYLAANMERINGELKVKTFEFISWNSKKQKFDFGFIACDEKKPQIRVVDGVRCFSCHKNKGPILGQGPWSNTTHNDVMRDAVAKSFRFDLQSLCLPESIGQPRRLDTGFDRGIVRVRETTADGVSLFVPQGPAVDASVRAGAEIAGDRQTYRQMLRTADGRRGFVVLLGAIAAPGDLRQNNDNAKTLLNREFATNYSIFAERMQAINKTSSSTLVDFNPSGSQGSLQNIVTATGGGGGWGSGPTLSSELRIVWGGNSKQVTEYDAKRSDGEHALPSNRQPSNPKAFVPGDSRLPLTPSIAVNAMAVARLIGLTEGDRAFLSLKLAEAADRVGKKVSSATIAKEVFNSPAFAELLTAGDVPDREDFKDRFVTGLNAVLKARGANEMAIARRDYASGPNVAPIPGKEEAEPVLVATTACLRCHDVRGVGKAAFSPIPLLAFDPLDKTSRETWAKVTPAKTRAQVLARMTRRLVTDRDMPPEDSAEYDAFRTKNPAAFDAMKAWLETEVQKTK